MTSARATGFVAAFLLVVFIERAGSFSRQLSEGDRCWDDGAAGTCRSLRACPTAGWALGRGAPRPTRCGFAGREEVVCCRDTGDSGVDRVDSRDTRDSGVDRVDRVDGGDRGDRVDSGGRGEDCQPGARGSRQPASRGWSTRQPAHNSWGAGSSFLENDAGHTSDGHTGNNNRHEQPVMWNTRKPSGTSSPSKWNTPKPTGTSSPRIWGSVNTDSRDGALENDGNGSSRRNEGAGNQLGSHNTHDAAGTSSQRRTQACESYKNFFNGVGTRILFGQNAVKNEFPHMAALGYQLPGQKELSWLCGGSLISDQYVLTAAHCCSSRERTAPVRVQLGSLNLTASTAADGRYGISEILIHPAYSRPDLHGDIALLRLDRRVTWTDAVCAACLYSGGGDPQAALVVTGWGATKPIGLSQSPVLLKTTIRPFPLLKCEQMYKERFPEGLDSSVMCAGDPAGKAGTCGGDSGGPLQIKEDPHIYSIVGITSIGPNPCGGTLPSIYTRVSSYIEWIEQHVWS